jgi:thiol:disulfide interchange protein DsbD
MVLLRADVTANTDFDQTLLKRFNVIAPPSILFFAPDGKELISARIIGEMNSKEFLNQLKKIKDKESASE